MIHPQIAFLTTLPGLRCRQAARRPVSSRRRAIFTMRDRSFWVIPHDKNVVTTALEANITHFMFTDSNLKEQCSKIAHFSDAVLVDDKHHFPGGRFVPIESPEDVDHAMQQAGKFDTIVVDPKDWKQIPVENLIAAYQSSTSKLLAVVHSADDASTMLASLQRGVDGVILRTTHISQIAPFAQLKKQTQTQTTQSILDSMCSATVTAVKPVGVGSRVCIDTCSLLQEDEGILIGSASQGMALVLSEAASVQYCPSRPFRVNAGPVHSYCLLPDGKTKYLCEVKAGDQVLIVKNGGKSCRTAVVGRAKIETRPLLMLDLVSASADGQSSNFNIFLQNAETVRVATMKDNQYQASSVCELQVGDNLMLRTDNSARHIGMPIKEDLIEK